ncbi:MAG: carboxymuconolactone decarboxylase family protein [Actinomycetota bacterium]|nr:carboxymuconolactone decarboxylase family protein [Actinomycetota bacterium]
MARVRIDHPRTLLVRLLEAYSRRKYGGVLEPGMVAYNNPKVLRTYLRAELSAAKWNTVERQLKQLAVMAAAAELGCSWCMDFGYWEAWSGGMPAEKLRAVTGGAPTDVFTPLERQVMAYAVAMTRTPVEVTDEQVAALRAQLSDAQVVELTFMIALENQRSRVNLAMGLTSQGFRELCEYRPHDAASATR